MKPLLIFTIFLLPLISGCKSSARQEYEKAIKEWTGKTVLFPDSMTLVTGEPYTLPEADFTIVAYYDSVGCTACRMKLPFWNILMEKADSIIGKGRVNLIIFAANPNQKKINQLLRTYDFSYAMVYDNTDRFNEINKLPKDDLLQAMLLDRNHEVLAIGNPTLVPEMEKLYFKAMGEAYLSQNDFDEEEILEHSFGNIPIGKEATHTFPLVNHTSDTLRVRDIVTSCDCTTGEISSKVIPPGKDYSLTTTFKDTIVGEFTRSVTVYFDNNPAIHFELTGTIQ